MDPKPWYLSKTLWFNIVTAITAALAVPEISTVIPATLLPYIVALGAFGNIILRVFSTSTPISK